MNSAHTLRLGVLGCGMIGHAFLRQARVLPGLDVAAVCSPSAASRESALRLWPNARAYADRAALLEDPHVDAVLVCTPHARHAEDAVAALTAGKHVLIEKPIATSVMELDELETAAAAHPDHVVLALPLVDQTALAALADLVRTSIIGRPMEFISLVDVPGPPRSNWYYSRAAVAGPSLDTLPYALARLLAVTGTTLAAATVSVTQAIQRRRCLDGGTLTQQVEDQITMQLAFPTGQQALVKSSWCLSRPEDYLIVRGRLGDIRLDCWRNSILVRSAQPPQHPHQVVTWDDAQAYRIDLPKGDPEHAKLAAFMAAVDQQTSTLPTAAFGMRLILTALTVGTGGVAPPPAARCDATTLLDLDIGQECQ
ncbi:MAG: Gfo/Idh/MocA family protein [Pseudonocardiaceae bacterium]